MDQFIPSNVPPEKQYLLNPAGPTPGSIAARSGLGPLGSEAALRPAVSFSEAERGQIEASERQPHNLRALDLEISRTTNPPTLALLNQERARLFAPPTPSPSPIASPPPTWVEVTRKPEFQTLSFEDKERVREKYWKELVLPRVPTEQIAAMSAAFDSDTKPGTLDRAVGMIGDTLRPMKEALTPTQGPEPTADELARAQQPARMTVTRQGQPVIEGEPRKPTAADLPADWRQQLARYDWDPDAIARPAWYQAAREMSRATLLKELGKSAADFPTHLKAAASAAKEGLEPDFKNAWVAASRDLSKKRAGEGGEKETLFPGLDVEDVRQLSPSLAFSVVSALSGLGIGIPVALIGSTVTRSPAGGAVAGYAAGGVASGVSAYRMAANQFLRDVREALDEQSQQLAGRPLSDEEWGGKQTEFNRLAREYGLFEAIPEAVGNVAGAKIILTASRVFGESVIARATRKLAALYGTELATETVTQTGQRNVEVEAGIKEGPKRSWEKAADIAESFKEIAPVTVLQTTLMAGGAAGTVKAYRAARGEPVQSGAQPQTEPEGPVSAEDVLGKPAPLGEAPTTVAEILGKTTADTGKMPAGVPAIGEMPTVDQAAHEAATSPENALPEPTEAQRDEGNYKKGHITITGLEISIENPEGSKRRPEWPVLKSHYGYIKGVPARAPDKEHVDVFVKPGTPENYSGSVFVVDQMKADGKFDEPKIMLGYDSEERARAAYLANYTAGWEKRIGGITQFTTEQFKARLQDAEAFKKTQEKPDAETVRIHQEPVGEARRAAEAGEDTRGADLQREAEARPTAADTLPRRDDGEARHPVDQRLTDDARRSELERMGQEAGWAEIGGKMIRTKTGEAAGEEVISRTKWIPHAGWWPGRPGPNRLNKHQVREAVRKALAGEKLAAAELRTVQYMLDQADLEASQRQAEAQGAEEFTEAELSAPEVARLVTVERERVTEAVDEEVGHAPDNWATMSEDEKNGYLDTIFGEDARPAARADQTVAAAAAEGRSFAPEGQTRSAAQAAPSEVTPPVTRQETPSMEGVSAPGRPAIELEGQTEAEAAADAARRAAEASRQTAEDTDAAARERADRERESFALTGSERAADVAAAAGQQDLLVKQPAGKRTAKTAAKREGIADVGENLWYNRRNFTGKALAWADVKDLNDTLKLKEVVKSKVWPRPDYEQLVEDGMQPFFARMLKQVYDGIATSPGVRGAPTDADLQRYITVVGRVRESVFDWAKDNNANKAFLDAIAERAKPYLRRGAISITEMMGTKVQDMTGVILDRVWPESVGQRNIFRSGEPMLDINVIGGRRAAKALQFTLDDAVTAMKDLEKGWPKAQQAWQKQGYKTVETKNSKVTIFESKRGEQPMFVVNFEPEANRSRSIKIVESKPEAESFVADLKPVILVDKRLQYVGNYDTKEQAEDAARGETKREGGRTDLRGMNISEAEREGPARRGADENVSAQRLMDDLGFRGVNFGREGWINQAERQAYLNHAYDALLDLAEILNVPPKALSLNGMLGIAFGAQGRGGAYAAHFVPGVNEINLTKTKGAGALAHEWGHALDHHFGVMAGLGKSGNPYLSEAGRAKTEGVRDEIRAAFQAIVDAMSRRPISPAELESRKQQSKARAAKVLESWTASVRSDLKAVAGKLPEEQASALREFDQLAGRLKNGDMGEGSVQSGNKTFSQVVAHIRNLYKDATGRLMTLETTQALENAAGMVKFYANDVEAARNHVPQTVSTEYQTESARADKEKGGKRYWATEREMFARAFETYIADRLGKASQLNTFLSDAERMAELRDREGGFAMPYPRGEDRARIIEAFDKLVGEVKTEETARGVTMLSRAPSEKSSFAAAVTELLRGKGLRDQVLELGITPAALRGVGLDRRPLKMTTNVAEKIFFDHGVPLSVIERLPELIADPVMVFESDTVPGTYVVAISEMARGLPIVVAVKPDTALGREVVHLITSVYPRVKPKEAFASWLRGGLLRYAHTQKRLEWQRSTGLQLPKEIPARGVGSRVLTQSDVVKFQEKGEEEPPKLSRDIGSVAGGMPIKDVNAVANIFRSRLKGLPPLHVLETVSKAPEALKRDIRELGGERDTAGAWHNGEVYLFAENLRNPEHAAWVILHEGTHHGLRGMWGRSLDPLLMNLYLRNKALRQAAEEQRVRNRKLSVVQATEEALANMGADNIPQSVWAQIIAWVRRTLRRLGVKLTVSDSDVRDLVARALRYVKQKPSDTHVLSGTALHPAWHGTPYDFDEFKLHKIGSGEGAQVYGWGLYFAGKQEVAEYYRDQLTDPQPTVVVDGRHISPSTFYGEGAEVERWTAGRLMGMVILGQHATEREDFDAALRKIAKEADFNTRRYNESRAQRREKEIADLARSWIGKATDDRKRGRLYRVELAPKEGEYLDWDKPLSEQGSKVRDAIRRSKVIDLFGRHISTSIGPVDNFTGEAVYLNLVEVEEAKGILSTELDLPDGASAQEAASRYLASLGIPGIRYLDQGSRREWKIAMHYRGEDEEVLYSAEDTTTGNTGPRLKTREDVKDWIKRQEQLNTYNYVIFDDRLVNIESKLSRTAAGAGEARVPTRTGAVDTLLRVPVQLLGIDKLTSWVYDDLIIKMGGKLVPETVKAGVIADYGVPEAVIDRRKLMQAKMSSALRATQRQIDRLMNLTRSESRTAYAWMTQADPAVAERLLAELPPESREVLQELKALVSSLGDEAVRLGQLSAEVHDRNRLSYLHRSYLSHETEQTKQQRASRSRAIRILGDQYKGRGMVQGVAMQRVANAAPEWWRRKHQAGRADRGMKGEKFIRLERHAPAGEGVETLPGVEKAEQRGRLLDVFYWPAAESVPARYGSWDRDAGEWEVRDVKGPELVMWRDFTEAERQRMGEIDEVKYSVAKTLHKMFHDIEAGRYLEWLTNRYARPTGEGLNVVKASESLLHTFKPGEWVQVPDTTIPGTKVARYGKLAGHYLPGPIWNDVRQVMAGRIAPLGNVYSTVLKAWKISKTALSPAVHLNNIMANIIMADWHDVRARDLVRALSVMIKKDAPENKALYESFEDSGGMLGTFVISELQREQMAPLLEELQREIATNEGAGIVNASGVLQAMLAGRYREAIDAAAAGRAATTVTKLARLMMDLYQAEDTVFRLAAFIKAKEEGRSDAEAGKIARKSFLDYEINAPWIQMMRGTVFPFVSFTYRAAPMLLETAAHKPWKLLKLALVLGGLNALGYALSGGDEDKERKVLPDERAGWIFGFLAPKLIRMAWNDAHGSPVFLDVRRFIPVGDIFDLGQTHSAIPLLPIAIPGGPLAVMAELIANRSQFTGREVTKETDTALETAGKVFDHIFKAMAPNIVFLPGTYAFKAVMDAGTGKTDPFGREQSLPMAVASSFGVKLAAYPRDAAMLSIRLDHDAKTREIHQNIRALGRELNRNGISREEFDRKVADQVEKLKKIAAETQKKLAE